MKIVKTKIISGKYDWNILWNIINLVSLGDLVEYLKFNTSDYLAKVIKPNDNECGDSDEDKSRSAI